MRPGFWIQKLLSLFSRKGSTVENMDAQLNSIRFDEPEIGEAMGMVDLEAELDLGRQSMDGQPEANLGDGGSAHPAESLLTVAQNDVEQDEEPEVDNSLFADIFEQQADDVDSPLRLLIDSLPDVSVEELLEKAEEVKMLIRGWHQE